MEKLSAYAGFGEPPAFDPAVLIREGTADGWRGLTLDGEILNVQGRTNGGSSEEAFVNIGGALVGMTKLPAESVGEIRYQKRMSLGSNRRSVEEPELQEQKRD